MTADTYSTVSETPTPPTIRIDQRMVGVGWPTFVIAEIGVNHDGSVSKALELVRIAKNCGADAVKIQIFKALSLVHPSCRMAEYQKAQLASDDPIDMLKRYEMTGDDVARVVRAIRDLQMMPLATPFSPSDLDLVERMRLPAIKIASPDLVNRPLLSAAAKLNKPLLVSTGAGELDEIDTTVAWMKSWNSSFSLLHCISSYPAASKDANLVWIPELGQRYGVPIGYSDHTTSGLAGGMAVSAGASIVEKHLTYDRSARGPDHAASADPTQFERYVKMIREADTLRGSPGKRVLEAEMDVRKVSRQSLVLRRSLKAGDRIREEDLTVQRPGLGVPAAQVELAIGKVVKASINAGTMLQWDMLDAA